MFFRTYRGNDDAMRVHATPKREQTPFIEFTNNSGMVVFVFV
ncbi:MAG: hypothetical protein PHF57_11670 [Methanoregula sp.]|nr:hypothetical protein [Methanoregula sp.]